MSPIIERAKTYLNNSTSLPGIQIGHLYSIWEGSDTNRAEDQWFRRKIRSIRKLAYNPSPRQQVVGNRRGFITSSEQEEIDIRIQLNNMKQSIQESYVRR